jgi:hypothetical protein
MIYVYDVIVRRKREKDEGKDREWGVEWGGDSLLRLRMM